MEYDQEDQGAIDDSQGSAYDTEQSVGDLWDIGVRYQLDGDSKELDDEDSVPQPIREIKRRGPRRKERTGDYRIPVDDLGSVQGDDSILWCIKLGWRPTKEQIEKYREIVDRREGYDASPGKAAKIGGK